MRRFIDVIFVDPKIKRYVVLHQGEFWQLPRLNLSVNAWSLKQPYTGELSDIFVAKEQGVACAELSQTLKTYDLPPQLHGQSAIGFLGWWQTNDYKWLSTKDVLTLDGTVDTAINTALTALPSTPKASTSVQEPSLVKPAPATPQAGPVSVTATQTNNPQSVAPTLAPTPIPPKPIATAEPKVAPTVPPKPKSADGELDIFDNLLNELTEEILHPH